jgi:hypothetical protein
MKADEFRSRQKKWRFFHQWEERSQCSSSFPDPLKLIGELLDICNSSGRREGPWTADMVQGILCLHKKLQFIRS